MAFLGAGIEADRLLGGGDGIGGAVLAGEEAGLFGAQFRRGGIERRPRA